MEVFMNYRYFILLFTLIGLTYSVTFPGRFSTYLKHNATKMRALFSSGISSSSSGIFNKKKLFEKLAETKYFFSSKKSDYIKPFFTLGMGITGYTIATSPTSTDSHKKISLGQLKMELNNTDQVTQTILYDEVLYKEYIDLINTHFYELITSEQRNNLFTVITNLIHNDRDNIDYFLTSIITNLKYIIDDYPSPGITFIHNIFKSRLSWFDYFLFIIGRLPPDLKLKYDNDKVCKDLVDAFENLFTSLVDNIAITAHSAPQLLGLITPLIADLVPHFCEQVVLHWNQIQESPISYKLAEYCILHDPSTISFFSTQIKPTSSIQFIEVVNRYAPCDKNIKKSLKQLAKDDYAHDFEKIARLLSYNAYCTKDSCSLISKINSSSTKNHLTENPSTLSKSPVLSAYANNKELSALANTIMSYEQSLQNNYYTFVHGQKSCYLLPELLNTHFYKIRNNDNDQHNFIYLHVKELNKSTKAEKQLRKSILKNGRGRNNRPYLLFANRALFGNETNPGSNTAGYILENDNVGNVQLRFEEIFKNHHLSENFYNKYKTRLEHLQQEYSQLTPYGTCMLIAIPKETIHKHVYLAIPGGYKKAITLKSGTSIHDIRDIMAIVQKAPELIIDTDQLEFCIPMTTDKNGGLNPESGIKIFPFSAANTSALDAWYAQVHALFDEIKKDIEQHAQ